MSCCSRCGAVFHCAMADPDDGQPCWCTRLPPILPLPAGDGNGDGAAACWCPDCLRQQLAAALPP